MLSRLRLLVSVLLATSAMAACRASVGHAEYVGNPSDMQDCCTRAERVCAPGDDWVACSDDKHECYRLGLWYADGIKVPRDLKRARELYASMCDRHEMGSCRELCELGDAARCVDSALLGIAAGGGRPFPPPYTEQDKVLFRSACSKGDQVACLVSHVDYQPGHQPLVRIVGNCFDDHARCFARACDAGDPVGCAVLCHVGDDRGCAELGLLALAGSGFRRPVAALGAKLLQQRCRQQRDPLACVVLASAFRQGKGVERNPELAIDFLDQACPWMPPACTLLGRLYRDGATVTADAAQADKYLDTACKHGELAACTELAVVLLRGPEPEREKERALSLLSQGCAEEGSFACRLLQADGKVCPAESDSTATDCVPMNQQPHSADGMPPYAFERSARAAASPAPPRAPRPEVPHVGEGLFSGWKTVHNVEGGTIGVNPVVTRVAGPRHRSTDASGLLGIATELYMRSWYPGHDKYLRFRLSGALGGGSAGVDGAVLHELTGGYRLPLSAFDSEPQGTLFASMSEQEQDAVQRAIFSHSPHALFVRGGYSMRYANIGPVLSSAIELPRVEAGYHFEGAGDGLRAFELRGTAGLVLSGRYDVDGDPHPLGGGFAWGGAAVLHSRYAHLELAAQRIQAALQGDRPPVHRVDTNVCLRVVPRNERHAKYLVCLQERLEHGQVGTAIRSDATSWHLGAFLGVDGLD
jgi:TPR repeat protein